MMFRGRVAAVSYLNTVPFIYGIEHADDLRAELLLSPPSGCAETFRSGAADVALLPAGALPLLDFPEPVTGYCIGAHAPVRTVMLMSTVPCRSIRRIWLDAHSMTSSLLVRIIASSQWGITPEYLPLTDYGAVAHPRQGDAYLLIGDKVFSHEGRLPYNYDLAQCWIDMTGLPFVFAVWVASASVPRGFISCLDAALGYGISNVGAAIEKYGHSSKPYAVDYLTQNIDFTLDDPKREALALYLDKVREYVPPSCPG